MSREGIDVLRTLTHLKKVTFYYMPHKSIARSAEDIVRMARELPLVDFEFEFDDSDDDDDDDDDEDDNDDDDV